MKRAVKLITAAHGVLGRLWAMVDSRKMSMRLYDTLNAVFARISRNFVGMTLSEYHDRLAGGTHDADDLTGLDAERVVQHLGAVDAVAERRMLERDPPADRRRERSVSAARRVIRMMLPSQMASSSACADRMCAYLSAADRLFMDETTAPVLDSGRGQTKKGFFCKRRTCRAIPEWLPWAIPAV
jgi:hypothetical protein